MSVFSDMFPCSLFELTKKAGKTGEFFTERNKLADIDVAIYKIDSNKVIANEKYSTSTHNGITFYSGFGDGKEYQLVKNGVIYEITYFNISGRQTALLLRRTNHG